MAPVLTTVAAVLVVCAINAGVYGVFSISDKYGTAFADVCAQLVQIDAGADAASQTVWVSNAALDEAFDASPSLATLKDAFDALRAKWGDPPAGDYTYWALREAASSAGYYIDAPATQAFWGQVSSELADAFSAGKLAKKSGLYISATTQPISWSAVPAQIVKSFVKTNLFMCGAYLNYDLETAANVATGTKEQQLLGASVLNDVARLSYDGADALPQTSAETFAFAWVDFNKTADYFLWVFWVLAFCVVFWRACRKDADARSVLPLLVGCAASELLVMFCVSWFVGFLGTRLGMWAESMYCAAIYPMYGVSLALCAAYIWRLCANYLNNRKFAKNR